jgi:hypothetical protein
MQGGAPSLAARILDQLADNAVSQAAYGEAAYYYYCLAMDTLKVSYNICV